jgi:hypothetical protein
MKSSFLRSNSPRVVQLANSLASMGWYLERREGEVAAMTPAERAGVEAKIGRPMEGKVMSLKAATQAYVATFYERPYLAKSDLGRVFLGTSRGGYFDSIFGDGMTAGDFCTAYQLKSVVDSFIRDFAACKRRRAKSRTDNWRGDYESLLGPELVRVYGDQLDQMVPQSGIFLCAVVFQAHVRIRGADARCLVDLLAKHRNAVLCTSLRTIFDFARDHKDDPGIANRSWPTLLKSQAFFEGLASSLGERR